MLKSTGFLLESKTETIEMTAVAPFKDNLEYIEARQQEYLLMVEIAGLKQQLFRQLKGSKVNPLANEENCTLDTKQLREKIDTLDAKRQQYKRINLEKEKNSGDTDIPFVRLRARTGINSFDEDVLWLMYFKAVSPDFYQLYEDSGFNTYGRERRGEIRIGNLLQIILPNSFGEQMKAIKRFHKESPLVACHLIEFYGDIEDCDSIQGVELNLPLRLINWISGYPEDILAQGRFRIERPTDKLENVILPDSYKDCLKALLERYDDYVAKYKSLGMDELITYGRSIVVLEYGPPGTGKTMLARAMSSHLGRPLISLRKDMDAGERYPHSAEGLVARLFREAKLQNGIVFLDECERLCSENGEFTRELLYELENNDIMVIMATNRPDLMARALDRRISLKLPFNIPDAASRLKIWRTLIPQGVTLKSEVDLGRLAAKYSLAGGYIKNAVLMALKAAVNRAKDGTIALAQNDLEDAAKEQERHVGGVNLYRKIVQPQESLEHCMVSAGDRERLMEIASLADGHRLLKLRQGSGSTDRHRGLYGFKVLFYGHEYTIAFQAAQGIAKKLGVNMETVILEDVLSEKDRKSEDSTITQFKVEHLFENAAGTGNILVFCDRSGLLGSKENGLATGGAFTRFERMLDEFDGTALLVSGAINLRGPEVQKMFHKAIFFGKPGPEMLKRYWEGAIGTLVSETGKVDCEELASEGSFTYEQVCKIAYLAQLKAETTQSCQYELNTALIKQTILEFRTGLPKNVPLFG
ncbi:MAG TPA: ATP-binding protein [archaeon]|nr:ATP-binding protein [archaeon]